jgi:hypothetical protein
MLVGKGDLEVPPLRFGEKDAVLPALGKLGETDLPSQSAAGSRPFDEPLLLFSNTDSASLVSGIVIWSWRTASTREVSG